ncbi:MAG: hypothetical protein ACFFCQ_07520 [Promethearchaeota archaeon]
MIHEFFCMLDHGTLLFHRQYQSSDDIDITLRANLISALYSFATTVEHDSIDFLRMQKASLIFQKARNLIFVLFLDSKISPILCSDELEALQEKFFDCFPEVLWNFEIVNLTMFKPFKEEADQILLPLAKKLEFMSQLFSDGLINEKDFINNDFESLGSIAGARLLEKTNERFSLIKSQEDFLENFDELLEHFQRTHIKRNKTTYSFDCVECNMCSTEIKNCFFEGFISEILSVAELEPLFPVTPQ